MLLVVYSFTLLYKAVLLFLESASFLSLISGLGTISEMVDELVIEILKFILAIFIVMTQSDPKFAHVTTAKLLWHVQNWDPYQIIILLITLTQDFDLRLLNCVWHGSLTSPIGS